MLALQQAIRDLHGCRSRYLESVVVTEKFGDQTVWEGTVEVFEIFGQPTASKCYAWSHEIEGSDNRRFVVVLHEGKVDSPLAAVRAAAVQEHRERHNGK